MSAAIEAQHLTKRYGTRSALTDCTLHIPAGRVVGLVGANGAGKSTLLSLAVGLLTPTSGTIEVLGDRPGLHSGHLTKVGFVAQDTPLYATMSVEDHLNFGAHMNVGWDRSLAQRRIDQVGLDPKQKAGRLSGGQRAQLALALAVAKRPELLLLDEPVAALDPLARRGFLDALMEFAGQATGRTVVLSSHLVSDLELVCDHLVVLSRSRVQLAGPSERLLAQHFRLTGPGIDGFELPPGVEVVLAERSQRNRSLVVRSSAPPPPGDYTVGALDLESLVLAYLARDPDGAGQTTGAPTR